MLAPPARELPSHVGWLRAVENYAADTPERAAPPEVSTRPKIGRANLFNSVFDIQTESRCDSAHQLYVPAPGEGLRRTVYFGRAEVHNIHIDFAA